MNNIAGALYRVIKIIHKRCGTCCIVSYDGNAIDGGAGRRHSNKLPLEQVALENVLEAA